MSHNTCIGQSSNQAIEADKVGAGPSVATGRFGSKAARSPRGVESQSRRVNQNLPCPLVADQPLQYSQGCCHRGWDGSEAIVIRGATPKMDACHNVDVSLCYLRLLDFGQELVQRSTSHDHFRSSHFP